MTIINIRILIYKYYLSINEDNLDSSSIARDLLVDFLVL